MPLVVVPFFAERNLPSRLRLRLRLRLWLRLWLRLRCRRVTGDLLLPLRFLSPVLPDFAALPRAGGGDLLGGERLTLRQLFFAGRLSLRLLVSLRLDALRFTGRYTSRLEKRGDTERDRDRERERERDREYELRRKVPRRSNERDRRSRG